jgi:carbon-monoxide dehydrogenase small subunit
MSSVELRVNGTEYAVDVEPRRLLADVLREECGLTGTKLGCEHGVCGSCTVLLDGQAVRSCLLLAVQCHGREISTVEGLASDDQLHPLQEAFSAEHGLQCGFCTAGFLMLAEGARRCEPEVFEDPEQLTRLLTSNLCRCTGYHGIVRAVRRAAGQDPE